MKNIKLKLCMTLCLLGLGLGSASAQDAAGFKPVELRTGVNNEGTPLSHKSLNNSGSGKITFSGAYESSYPRYNYNLTLGYQGARNYAYELFTFQQSVPAYSRLRLTLRNTWIHQYNLSYTTYKVASASTFTVFETEKSARETYLIANPSTTPYSNPGDGQLYIHVYNPGDKNNVTSARASQVSYFDNRSGSAQKTITKWAVLATYSAYGNGSRRAYLLVEPMNGAYVDKNYDYYKHITFNANGGTGTMAQQTVENSAALSANTFTREGFTFAGWSTTPSGVGSNVKNYSDKATITATAADKGPVTLYAQWTAEPIKATFDYTYRSSESSGTETYEHMSENVQGGENPFTQKVRAVFRDHNRTVLKQVVLTAPTPSTQSTHGESVTSDLGTHKTAEITLNVTKGSGTDALSGANCTVYLSDEEYTNYRSVDFEVLTNASNEESQQLASHWVSRKEHATNYVFKYEGHESNNMFLLTWRVNLKNLSMYPADIFVKPMREGTHDGGSELAQIPAMNERDGEVCELAGYIKSDESTISLANYNALEDKSGITIAGAYYEGEYNVLKTCNHGSAYNYKIGLTGFTLDGITYYLSKTEGDIPTDMISTDNVTVSSTSDKKEIVFDREDKDIPVLILSPGEGATVSGRENYKLYVDNDTEVDSKGQREVKLDQFEAVRPNYDFVGWKDTRDENNTATTDGNVYSKDEYYHFNLGTKATTTLEAQWVRTNAPEVEHDAVVEDDANNTFIYKVKVGDELSDVKSVQYIYTDSDTEESAAAAQEWCEMTKSDENDSIYTNTINMLNDVQGKHLWVKASNTDKSNIIYLGQIRSIFKVEANPNPDSHTVLQVADGTWEEKGEGQEPEFKPNGNYLTTDYYDYYSTFFYGDHAFTANDVSVYTAKISGNKLELEEIEADDDFGHVIIPAETAVILRKKQAIDGTIELEEHKASVDALGRTNNLSGTDNGETISSSDMEHYYIFSYAQHGLGFYLTNTTTLAPHKAYINLEETGGIRAFTFDFSEGDPIVEAIREIEATGKTSVTIDLSGRKVMDGGMHGGIYMKGGSKLLK